MNQTSVNVQVTWDSDGSQQQEQKKYKGNIIFQNKRNTVKSYSGDQYYKNQKSLEYSTGPSLSILKRTL